MKKLNKADIKAAIESEKSRNNKNGKVTRNASSRKVGEREQSYNLFWVCDSERKHNSCAYLESKEQAIKDLFGDDYQTASDLTQGFTLLLASESETGDKYKNHIDIGRKVFGSLDYFPCNLEGLLTVFEGARLALKELRVAAEQQQRAAVAEQNRQAAAASLSIEQLQEILAAKLAEQNKK